MDMSSPGERDTAAPDEPVRGCGHAEVVLIGYQDQGNLGMGYLAAVLERHGCVTETLDVREGGEKIAALLAGRQPLIVGFSLIFQFFLPQFRRVATHLREAGITSHFTIGGHYPSLCHDELLINFPEIDSVVRGGGVITLQGGAQSSLRPDTVRDSRSDHEVHEGRMQTEHLTPYAGSGLKPMMIREGTAWRASLPAVLGKTRRTE